MSKVIKFLLLAVASLMFTFIFGGIVASVAGASFWLGGVIAVVGSAIVGMIKDATPPDGSLRAGVFTEVWTGYLVKAFRNAEAAIGWYSRIHSFDQYVNNDVIHLVDVGADPEILINNTTYPLEVQELPDGDKAIVLDKYQSKVVQITDDELHAISYDKMAVKTEQLKEAYSEKKFAKAIHSLAPAGNTDKTHVILTTGEDDGTGRKKLMLKDITALKRAFDKAKIPAAGRILVLTPDHVSDICEQSQSFKDQFYNLPEGKVYKLYGFDIYEYVDSPYYNVGTKTKSAFGAIPSDNTYQKASVAFTLSRAMRADAPPKVYVSPAEVNPETQANTMSMRAYNICLPLRNEGLGAIVSDTVA